MNHEKTFILNSDSDFKKAERYKATLENRGLKVVVTTHGLNGVKITGAN
jgi:hypothetical protein